MAAIIDTHVMFTPGTSSATGTLNASQGDLIVAVLNLTTGIALGSVSGAGLNWVNAVDSTVSSSHLWIFTAVASAGAITSQTITVTATGSSLCSGSLIAISNARRIGAFNNASSLGASSTSNTLVTTGNGSLVLSQAGGSDIVYTSPALQLDYDGTTYHSGTAGSTYAAGTSVTVAITSAGGTIGPHSIYEVMTTGKRFNNTGLRPHPFSPGLAR